MRKKVPKITSLTVYKTRIHNLIIKKKSVLVHENTYTTHLTMLAYIYIIHNSRYIPLIHVSSVISFVSLNSVYLNFILMHGALPRKLPISTSGIMRSWNSNQVGSKHSCWYTSITYISEIHLMICFIRKQTKCYTLSKNYVMVTSLSIILF